MVFYKYLTKKRINVLEKRRIRFTQPNAMNDPFEARPDFYLTDKGRARAIADTIRNQTSMWELVRSARQTTLGQQAYAAKLEGEPDCAKELCKRLRLQIPVPNLQERLYQLYNHVGILSLSEAPDNLLMWTHYAEEHTGFAREFDGSHDFFKGDKPVFGFAKPEPVEYSSERPRMQINDPNMSAIFFTKGIPWKYEREWRYLKAIEDADVLCEQPNALPVALFQLPPKCIVSVIFGCYRDQALQNKILDLRRDCPELRHLRIQQARASNTRYRLQIEEIEI